MDLLSKKHPVIVVVKGKEDVLMEIHVKGIYSKRKGNIRIKVAYNV
jgi:hypothetical protein